MKNDNKKELEEIASGSTPKETLTLHIGKTVESFTENYSKLCEAENQRINVNPTFMARDDGTWSIVLNTSVTELPVKNK